jgi:hypothetical protein
MSGIPLPEVNVTGLGRDPLGLTDVSGLAEAIASVSQRGVRAVGLRDGGELVAVIVPIGDVHEAHGCCCQHCPWGGVHPGPPQPRQVR